MWQYLCDGKGDVGYEPLLISDGIRKKICRYLPQAKVNDSTIIDMTFFRWQRLAPLQPNHCPYSTEDNVCFDLIKSSTNCSYICAYAQPLVLYPALWVEMQMYIYLPTQVTKNISIECILYVLLKIILLYLYLFFTIGE